MSELGPTLTSSDRTDLGDTDATAMRQGDADLAAENAELRETLKRRNRQLETMTDMWAARGAENAKLRELVLQLWECPVDDNKCTDCPHCKEHYDVCAGENHCKLYDRMRELGVEVEP